jgi:transcriptional regulator with XRE-family HTH domain
MSEMGARLKQERKRLGYSQREMGLVGGVAANAQGKYESGERVPKADYLAALASVGVDVLYVLTNTRISGTTVDNILNKVNYSEEPNALLLEVKHAVRHFLLRIEELSTTYGVNDKSTH